MQGFHYKRNTNAWIPCLTTMTYPTLITTLRLH